MGDHHLSFDRFGIICYTDTMPYTKEPTARQMQIFNALLDHIQRFGFPPTLQELADAVGIKTPRGALIQLRALEKKGYIRLYHVARGIQILRRPNDQAKLD